MLRTAWRWGAAARLHTEPLHLPPRSSIRLEKVADRSISREDAWATYDALLADEKAAEWVPRVYLFALLTGARPREIAALQVGDFELGEAYVRVGIDRERGIDGTKTGQRTVFLDAEGVELLRPYVEGREPDERFAGTVAEGTARTGYVAAVRRAARAAGAPPHTLYSLRTAMTNAFYDAGVPAEVEAAQLGHSVEVAQRKYRKLDKARVAAGVAKVAPGRRPERRGEDKGNEDSKVVPLRRRGSR